MLKMNAPLTVALALFATACATPQDPTDDFANGWRRAQVLEVGNAALTVRSAKQDCRPVLGANPGFDRFALASYSYGGSPNLKIKRIVAIPNHISVSQGDWVFVNISNCKLPLKQASFPNKRP